MRLSIFHLVQLKLRSPVRPRMRESRHIKVKVKLINQSWKSWALASRDILCGEEGGVGRAGGAGRHAFK